VKFESLQSDAAILGELARRLARTRLERNLTQAQVAARAGIGRATLQRLEAGGSGDLSTLIRVLRALDMLGRLELLVPETTPTPIERLRLRGSERQRARMRVSSASHAMRAPEHWRWGDEEHGSGPS
jgi:transcriptional regulator with XRE-family HTH domain